MGLDTDVFIVGGGPAGLGAAIAARRKGLRVTLADSRRPPIDKPCGEGLQPDALAAATALGIAIPQGDSFPMQGIRFLGSGGTVEARFRSGPGLGVRRTVLHRELTEEAQRAGVTLLWDTGVRSIAGNEIALSSGTLRARWIVGADGERSRVRAWAGLDGPFLRRARFGFRRHYRIAPWSEFIEIHWERGLQVYVTPVAADEVGIACVSRDSHMRVDTALARLPELREHLSGAAICSAERGGLSSTRRLRAVYKGSIALVGDASGSVDVVTGQGVGIAFQQGVALADALEHGELGRYQDAHRRIARRPAFMAEMLLAMDRWPRIGTRTRQALSKRPELFERLLAMHVGDLDGGWEQAAAHGRLAWSVLTG